MLGEKSEVTIVAYLQPDTKSNQSTAKYLYINLNFIKFFCFKKLIILYYPDKGIQQAKHNPDAWVATPMVSHYTFIHGRNAVGLISIWKT